jgi:UDP-sugar diphosphatase
MSVEIQKIEPITDSAYIKPKRITYIEEGVEKTWDVIEAHDSVSVVVFHEDLQKYLFVRMFRPAVHNSGGSGYVLDLCAGLVDKNESLETIIQEEILEELGYLIPLEHIGKGPAVRNAVGLIGSTNTIFFATVSDKYKMSDGGGIADENIEVVAYTLKELKEALKVEEATLGVYYALEQIQGELNKWQI